MKQKLIKKKICLDSGAGNWDQLWITSTLRGIIGMIIIINSYQID